MGENQIEETHPTEEEFETCSKVLEWLTVWYEKNEPYAGLTIDALREASLTIPLNVEELKETK